VTEHRCALSAVRDAARVFGPTLLSRLVATNLPDVQVRAVVLIRLKAAASTRIEPPGFEPICLALPIA